MVDFNLNEFKAEIKAALKNELSMRLTLIRCVVTDKDINDQNITSKHYNVIIQKQYQGQRSCVTLILMPMQMLIMKL